MRVPFSTLLSMQHPPLVAATGAFVRLQQMDEVPKMFQVD